MNKINMSDFLKVKKVVFNNGEGELVRPQINGEISINEFDEKMVKKIQEEVMDKLTEKEIKNDNYFVYKIFPYIANVNMDVNYKQFEDLIKKPRRPFSLLLEMVINEIEEMFETAKDLNRINEKAEILKENNKDLLMSEELLKEKREEELLEELSKCYHDREKRNEILMEINKLGLGV